MMVFYSCNFRTCETGVSRFYSPVRQLFFPNREKLFSQLEKKRAFGGETWISCFAFTEQFREKQNFLR